MKQIRILDESSYITFSMTIMNWNSLTFMFLVVYYVLKRIFMYGDLNFLL